MLGWLLLCPALLPVTADPACQDDLYRECGGRAAAGECGGGAGQDHELARRALAECRQSCRAVHPAPAPSRLVSLYGGLGDSLHDQFGFQYRLCDPTGGFTSAGRAGALRHHALTRLQPLWVPAFTQRGFQAAPLPVQLWRRLETEYKQALSGLVVEQCEPSVINCQVTADLGTECAARQDRRTLITQLSPALLESVSRTLLPLAEQWAGLKLEHTATYGVRRYNNGSWLSAHVDIFHTHVISAIINLGTAKPPRPAVQQLTCRTSSDGGVAAFYFGQRRGGGARAAAAGRDGLVRVRPRRPRSPAALQRGIFR